MHSLHLVAQHYCVASVGVELQVLKLGRPLHLLYAVHEEAVVVQRLNRLGGSGEVAPRYGVFASERRLVNFGVGWGGSDAAKVYRLDAEGVARAEHRTHVVQRTHVVEHYDKGQFGSLVKLVNREPLHFYSTEFAHIILFMCKIR